MSGNIQTLVRRKSSIDKVSGAGRLFDIFNAGFMIVLCFVMIYPFWYVLVYSLNTGADAMRGPIWFWPRQFTLDNYRYVIENPYISRAFLVTIARVLIAPTFSVTVNMLAAYALSKRFLPGRRGILYFFLIPMFIGGTTVSNFVVIAKLGLLNNFLVYVLPGAFGFFTMVLMRTFIEQIPEALEESARIDGANHNQVFVRIILPLSKPILAAMLFFAVVGAWLDFGTTLLYITDRNLYVLQYVLYMVMLSNQAQSMLQMVMSQGASAIGPMSNGELPTPEVLKMAILVTVTVPLLFVYPFFQKYFVQGMMVGAVKS